MPRNIIVRPVCWIACRSAAHSTCAGASGSRRPGKWKAVVRQQEEVAQRVDQRLRLPGVLQFIQIDDHAEHEHRAEHGPDGARPTGPARSRRASRRASPRPQPSTATRNQKAPADGRCRRSRGRSDDPRRRGSPALDSGRVGTRRPLLGRTDNAAKKGVETSEAEIVDGETAEGGDSDAELTAARP